MESLGCKMVENWLRSIGQLHYTRAFLDNGYDDLEVCKQIGHSDLDAIGVHKPQHRIAIYNAVEVLRSSKDATKPLYFLLENPNSPSKTQAIGDEQDPSKDNSRHSQGVVSQSSSFSYSTSTSTSGISDNASERSTTLNVVAGSEPSPGATAPRINSTLMDKHTVNHVVLIHSEYRKTGAKGLKNDSDRAESFELDEIDSKENSGFSSLCSVESSKSSLDDVRIHQLSKAGSSVSMDSESNSTQPRNLKLRASTSLMDEELLLGEKTQYGLKSSTSFSGCHGYSSNRRARGWRPLSMAEPGTSGFTMMSAYGQSNRSVPPPLPRNPPPVAGSHSDMSDFGSSVSQSAVDKGISDIEYLAEPEACAQAEEKHGSLVHEGQKKLKSLSRFFSFKKSNKKTHHKPPHCDINARDITMSDEDRIRLLIMVKEGRVSMDEAVNTVKRYEMEKKSGIHKNLNDYIPEETVKIPVATDKSSRLLSPFRFLRSLSFTKGSKRKKFLRDLEFYYKEQEKRQKLIQERMAAVKIEDGNYSQPVCCSNNRCGAEPQKCHVCSHGNRSHIRRNLSNEERDRTSDFYLSAHSNRRQFLKPVSYEHQELHSPHRVALNQYADQRYPSGYHSPCSSGYQDSHGGNYPEHGPPLHGGCTQCNPMPASLSRRQFPRTNSQPVTVPQLSPYFQRDVTRHSFHSMPFRGSDHELVPYLNHMPYSHSFTSRAGYPACGQYGYPLPSQGCASTSSPCYHPGMVPHTILEERSPCVSARSSMDNIHLHSPIHLPSHTQASVHRQLPKTRFDDVSNNNPTFRRHEQQYTNSTKLAKQVDTEQSSRHVINQNSECKSTVDNEMASLHLNSNALPEIPSDQYTPKRNIGVSGGIQAEDEENANTAELSTSSVTTESGCGASIRSSQQENYAQTCHVGRNPSSPESVEELCEKLGIQHLLEIFVNNGFETLELFKQIEEEDLETLGILQPTDRAKVLTAVTLLPEDDCDMFTYTYRPVSDIYSTVNKCRPSPVSNSSTPSQTRHITTAEICTTPLLQTRDSGCYIGVDNSNVAAASVQHTTATVTS